MCHTLAQVKARPACIGSKGCVAVVRRTLVANVVEAVGLIVVLIVRLVGGSITPHRTGTFIGASRLRLRHHIVQRGIHVVTRSKTAHAIDETADAGFHSHVVVCIAGIYVHAIVIYDHANRRLLIYITTGDGLNEHVLALGKNLLAIVDVRGNFEPTVSVGRSREAVALAVIVCAVPVLVLIHVEHNTGNRVACCLIGLDQRELVLDVGNRKRHREDALKVISGVGRKVINRGSVGPIVFDGILRSAGISAGLLDHVLIRVDVTRQIINRNLIRSTGPQQELITRCLRGGHDGILAGACVVNRCIGNAPAGKCIACHGVVTTLCVNLSNHGKHKAVCRLIRSTVVDSGHIRWRSSSHMSLRVGARLPLVARKQHAIARAISIYGREAQLDCSRVTISDGLVPFGFLENPVRATLSHLLEGDGHLLTGAILIGKDHLAVRVGTTGNPRHHAVIVVVDSLVI